MAAPVKEVAVVEVLVHRPAKCSVNYNICSEKGKSLYSTYSLCLFLLVPLPTGRLKDT